MTFYYPYSTTYLRTNMERLSRGIVVTGLAIIAWVLVLAGVGGLWQVVT